MPTTVIETIGPGQDYATFNLWETATRLDLVALDEIRVGLMMVLEAAPHSTINAIGTSDATRYREVRSGAVGAGLTFASGGLDVSQAYSRATGLRLRYTGSESGGIVCTVRDGGVVSRCLIEYAGTSVSGSFKLLRTRNNAGFSATIRSCVLDAREGVSVGPGSNLIDHVSGTGPVLIENCTGYATLANFGVALDGRFGGTWTVRNTAMFGAGTQDFLMGTAPTVEYCASGDATADDNGGAGNLINIVAESALSDPANGDFALASGSQFIGAGVAVVPGFNDIAGNAHGRAGAWDIGAYSAAAVVYPPTPLLGTTRQHLVLEGGATGASAVAPCGGISGRTARVQSVAGTTATVLLQGRAHPLAPWITVGTATNTQTLTGQYVYPEMRLNATANGSTIDAWLVVL